MANITNLTLETKEGASEVSAFVNGERLWFRSSEETLCPSPEGFLSAFLYPALHHNSSIRIDATLDPVWLANIKKLMIIFNNWWKTPFIEIYSKNKPNDCSEALRSKKALCFSGGVDSFYSLLQNQNDLDLIIFIVGFDISLDDLNRIRSFKTNLIEIGKHTKTKPVTVTTNLRLHSLFKKVSWERSHGGALAAIGYFLGSVNTLMISSSYPYYYNRPWGSHFETDHLWSSSHLKLTHYGAEVWRTEKLIKIKDNPLVQNHLRVCWENRNEDLNCCECEKCLRTMLPLKQCQILDKYTVFREQDHLTESINRLNHVSPFLLPVYRNIVKYEKTDDIKHALKALIRRSQPQRLRNLAFYKGSARLMRLIIPWRIYKIIKRRYGNQS